MARRCDVQSAAEITSNTVGSRGETVQTEDLPTVGGRWAGRGWPRAALPTRPVVTRHRAAIGPIAGLHDSSVRRIAAAPTAVNWTVVPPKAGATPAKARNEVEVMGRALPFTGSNGGPGYALLIYIKLPGGP